MSMKALEQFIGQFRLIECAPTNDRSAVPDRITLDPASNSEETKAVQPRGLVLFLEALTHFVEGHRCAVLVLSEEFEVPRGVVMCAQSKVQSLRDYGERHGSVAIGYHDRSCQRSARECTPNEANRITVSAFGDRSQPARVATDSCKPMHGSGPGVGQSDIARPMV